MSAHSWDMADAASLAGKGLCAIVPVLNAATSLAATLAAIQSAEVPIFVVDGGSADSTADVARRANARVLVAPRGRGIQLGVGAAEALEQGGRWLLFVHADTRLPEEWMATVRAFIDTNVTGDRAGYFRLAFDEPGPQAARAARLANWRSRVFGMPYGDQTLLVPAELYRAVGGYRPIPLMEDVDLVLRIGRARLFEMDGTATTSADRYRREGWWLRPARNLTCLALWMAGVSPERLVGLYRGRR